MRCPRRPARCAGSDLSDSRAIGGSIDVILGILLAGGVVFAFSSKKTAATFVFDGDDLRPGSSTDRLVFEAQTPTEQHDGDRSTGPTGTIE